MRARTPDVEGYVDRDGVKIGYEMFGAGEPAVVFPSSPTIVQSRTWKAQVPYLARRSLVVTMDPRGNGRSDRPVRPEDYASTTRVGDTLAVMDATGVDRAVLITFCSSTWPAMLLAAQHPERVLGIVVISAHVPYLTPPLPERKMYSWYDELDTDEGWAKENRHYWLRDWRGYAEFFFTEVVSEPHSTKQREDCIAWAAETTPEVMIACETAPLSTQSKEESEAVVSQVRCPVLVIHGTDDKCQPYRRAQRLAELTGGELVELTGAGHAPQAREPIVVNRLIGEFVQRFAPSRPPRRWVRPLDRPRRVLFLSSPIGLGHTLRDIAIADELQRLRPGLEIDWLAQHPVTEVLSRRGHRIHPASRHLANESAHVESEAAEHDLHVFHAIRRMDEILVANFMVFHDLVEEEEHYDAWIGDEAWELDYFLHENPELKRAPYAWLTDFVGWLPMSDGGQPEMELTADYNAEMVEQIARFPRLRDRAIFVGDPDDIVPDRLGPDLPGIREWTEQHFDFAGYVTGFDHTALADRAALRAELGYQPDEQVCVVTVGGSGVGGHLLRRVVAAYPEAKRRVPALRMVVVTGPRIDPASLPATDGLEVRTYVDRLYRHLAACDLAVVQGGLTTCMELTALQRPFLCFPLEHHFEQNFHVRHRLERYGAGRRMTYATSTPDVIAAAIAEEIGRSVRYRPVRPGGAARAAALLTELF